MPPRELGRWDGCGRGDGRWDGSGKHSNGKTTRHNWRGLLLLRLLRLGKNLESVAGQNWHGGETLVARTNAAREGVLDRRPVDPSRRLKRSVGAEAAAGRGAIHL